MTSATLPTPEGASSRKPPTALRASLVQVSLVVFAATIIGRAAKVQLFDHSEWRDAARNQQVAANPLPAPRGQILDEAGNVLVESRQLVKLAVAPRDVAANTSRKKDDGAPRVAALTRALARAGVSQEWLARVRDTSRAWVELPGRFLASDVQLPMSTRGVHVTPAMDRVPPSTDGLRRLVGRADDAGGAVDGLEKSLDGLLRGSQGREALVRDSKGRRIRSPLVDQDAPTPGSTVVLSLNQSLQDIAERSLGQAVSTMGASGGDIVVMDVATGEVRAMASKRSDPLSTVATGLTEPYEPGSTLKPFVAARLLDLHRARIDEVVPAYGGIWNYNGRKIEDDHKGDRFSLFDVIRYSSNIGIVQFAQRFSPNEQYELLRDLGFGTPTGIPYPVESQGVLPAPRHWDQMTPASLAMGYALNVTPVQLATAYTAIANGGELLEPAIVKEIRTPTGEVTWRHSRRVVRRVMSPEAAASVREMLRGVVETGTAAGSNLSTFDIAGKTGTAKRAEHGKYVAGKYTASFVGMFPADKPQVVILVKLDNPSKSIYGGKAAAPVSKAVLQAAIAARDASLDRGTLATATKAARAAAAEPAQPTAPIEIEQPTAPSAVPYDVRLDEARETTELVVARRAVPAVTGMSVRHATRLLHQAGFRVALAPGASGADLASGTYPAAGSQLATGARVVLEGKQ